MSEETPESIMASTETIESEITHLKEIFPGQVRVIRDLGEYKYVINVKPQGLDVTLKFQLTESYPESCPNIIVKFSGKVNGAELLSQQISNAAQKLKGYPMVENLVDYALDEIEEQGIDVQSAVDKTRNTKKGKGKKKHGKSSKGLKLEDEEERKKVSMKTADDVVNRIMWDDSVPTDEFTVGYMDRFVGMVEKNFGAFSWEDLASVDYTVLAIPKHRIHYFKYKDLKVWDKDARMDNVFGSTGSNITITEAISMYEEQKRKSEQTVDKHDDDGEDDDDEDDDDEDDSSDDGIEITINSGDGMSLNLINATENMGEMLHESRKAEEETFWEDKLRPNYFLAVRVRDPDIVKKVQEVRESLLKQEPRYKECCIPDCSLHITLCVIRLDSDAMIANAVQVLHKAKTELAKISPKGKALKLEGVDNFYNRVIYAKVHYTPEFLEMVDHLKLCLWEGGVSNKDGYDFVPHMTIMKVSRPVARQIGTSKVKPGMFSTHKDAYFGTQAIEGIHLCAMGDERREDGFYITPTSLHFEYDTSTTNVTENEESLSDVEDMIDDNRLDGQVKIQHLSVADQVRSNFCLTVRINNPQLVENVKTLQEKLRQRCPVFQDFCIPPDALHITFGTTYLDSESEVQKAKQTLEKHRDILSSIMSKEDSINLEGLGVFFGRIVYAKVMHSHKFLELLSAAVKCLSDNGIVVREKQNYLPHVTILRVSLQDARIRQLPEIKPDIFQNLENIELGSQVVEGVHLTSVGRLS